MHDKNGDSFTVFIFRNMPKKIKDNESIKSLTALLNVTKLGFKILDKVPFIYRLSPKAKILKEQFLEMADSIG